jgi:alkaline phosphatase
MLGDTIEYNKVVSLVSKWIDEHPDTVMISVADHDTGGLSLTSGYDLCCLKDVAHSVDYWSGLWDDYEGDSPHDYLVEEILPNYGFADASTEEIEALLEGDFGENLAEFLSDHVSFVRGTGGHTAADTTLHTYGVGGREAVKQVKLAGHLGVTE